MKITIPKEWTLATQHHGQNAPTIAMFAKYGSLTNVLLAHEHLEVSAENYLHLIKNLLSKEQDYTELGTSTVKRDGLEGVRWNATWTSKGVRFRGALEVFTEGDEHYRIFAVAPDDNFDRYSKVLGEIVDSIQFPARHVDPKQIGPE